MDQSMTDNSRLRSALFGTIDDDSSLPVTERRVLERSDRPIRKRTPSDLGHPNGKRTLGLGR